MESFSHEVTLMAQSFGADMVGFAPVSRFDTGPEKTHPNTYMPQARSVVVIGKGKPIVIQ